MTRKEKYKNLVVMLEELDTQKNDSDTLRYVLDFIANQLKEFINDIK